ncbi:MAG TPA: type 1 glutamine amidotransferase domain-containing protein [Phototrophicaceae bacterium]|nr:type 1 glutamine amidotransferase domain-containing protein [Phototrophicaceae bacterium]
MTQHQTQSLQGKKVAMLVANGFEQAELLEPRKALQEAGAQPVVISPEKSKVRAWDQKEWGQEVSVDVTLDSANPADYDALVLPGGVMNPDKLRINPQAVQFVRAFVNSGKPIAAICHGPWTLIEAGGVQGRKMTSYPSLQSDLRNAGANWVDQEVVVDHGLVTSRNVPDIPAFNRKLIEEIAEGQHARQPVRG